MKKKYTRQERRNLFDKGFQEIKHALDTMTKRELQYELDHRDDKDWKNEQEKFENRPILHLNNPDHKKPITRRDFVAQGLIAGAATMVVPKYLQAQTVCPTAAAGLNNIPFFTMDGAGGFSMGCTNFIAGVDSPSNPFNDYNNQGLPVGQRPQDVAPNTEAGIAMHSQSFILAGIKSRASATTLAKTSGFIVCAASGDDSSGNKQVPHAVLAQLGLLGELASVAGTSTDESGTNSSPTVSIPAFRSTQVSNPTQAAGLNQPGTLLTVMQNNQNQANLVVQAVADTTTAQANKLNPVAVSGKTKDVIICGANKNVDNFKAAAINVQSDAAITTIFPQVATNGNDDAKVGSLAYLAMNGKIGPAGVEFGGCDYHGNGNANKQARDTAIGRAIGGVLEYAAQKGQPVAINIITDGSVSLGSPNDGQVAGYTLNVPTNDNGNNGLNVMIVFDPNGRVPVTKPQLGKFGSGGVVAGSSPWAGNPMVGSMVIIANYMYLMGKIDTFNKMYPNPGFVTNDVLAFGRTIK